MSTLLERFARRLLRLFPTDFRERFGAEIVEQIRSEHRQARSRGRLRAAAHGLTSSLDLIASALGERLSPTWPPSRMSARRPEKTMSDAWTHDLRLALRSLRRSPGFVAAAVATLGLAIGANAGIFSVVDAVLLDPLPFASTDRLVHIGASAPGSEMPPEFGVSAEFLVQYSELAEQLEDVAGYDDFTSTFRTDDRVERIRMAFGTPRLFQTLGVTPILGRLPSPEDEDDVVVLSHALWSSWFGSDPEVIGRSYYVSGRDRTVIGVMGPNFWFPNDRTLLWFNAPIETEEIQPGRMGLLLVGRLAPGTTREALALELDRLARGLPERFGGSPRYAELIELHRAIVTSFEEELLGDLSEPLWLLLGSMGIVLLIACANVANLFLVRAESRQRDLAVQRAIGASRGQLVRAQMAEALVVAALAGVLALALARLSVPLLVAAAPQEIPRLGEVEIGGSTLLFTLAAAVLSALLFGLLPALRASGASLLRLREGGRGATGRRHWGRAALVVTQTALALLLLIGSALLARSFWKLRNVDPGYDVEDVFTFQIAPEQANLTDGPTFARFHRDFAKRVAALPGVESVGLIENVPLNEGVAGVTLRREGTASEADGGILLSMTVADGGYFETMDIAVLQGRTFVEEDQISQLGNVVLSRTAADRLWPGESPLGRRIQLSDDDAWHTVVGVVEDIVQSSFRDEPEPLVYFPLVGPTPTIWVVSSPAYVVKTARAEEIAPEIRALVNEVAPEAPMYRTYTMAELAADSMVQLSFTAVAVGIASVLALALGAIGLYGVLSYVVAERTPEIGVRMALGAAPRRVQLMVVAQGVQVVLLGIAAGLLGAIAMTRWLDSLLYGVEAVDATTFVATAAAMILLGMLATWLPARRASAIDPIRSLRAD